MNARSNNYNNLGMMTTKQKWLLGGLSLFFCTIVLLWIEMAVGVFGTALAGS